MFRGNVEFCSNCTAYTFKLPEWTYNKTAIKVKFMLNVQVKTHITWISSCSFIKTNRFICCKCTGPPLPQTKLFKNSIVELIVEDFHTCPGCWYKTNCEKCQRRNYTSRCKFLTRGRWIKVSEINRHFSFSRCIYSMLSHASKLSNEPTVRVFSDLSLCFCSRLPAECWISQSALK